jgi:hypothetical protein
MSYHKSHFITGEHLPSEYFGHPVQPVDGLGGYRPMRYMMANAQNLHTRAGLGGDGLFRASVFGRPQGMSGVNGNGLFRASIFGRENTGLGQMVAAATKRVAASSAADQFNAVYNATRNWIAAGRVGAVPPGTIRADSNVAYTQVYENPYPALRAAAIEAMGGSWYKLAVLLGTMDGMHVGAPPPSAPTAAPSMHGLGRPPTFLQRMFGRKRAGLSGSGDGLGSVLAVL